MAVTRPREILLGTNFYPLVGEVKLSSVDFAQKQVIGDYTKDSERFTSSITWSDQRGGIGIKDMVEGKDDNRAYFSTCELGFKGHLVLPPLATSAGNPTTASTDAAQLIEYSNLQYCAFGADLRHWIEGTSAWAASDGTLIATPTDSIVHKSKLYFACGTDFNRWDGATLTTGTALSGGVVATRYFCEWDSKLFSLSNTGVLKYSSNEGATWTTLIASGNLETGFYTSLYLDFDSDGTYLVHMGTRVGTYVLDFNGARWVETGLNFPQHDYAALGSHTWRDAGYIPVGMAIYQYRAGTPATITPMGPDRDYGVPSTYRGNIIKVLPEHNAIYALVDATSEQTRDLYHGSFRTGNAFYDNQGQSIILKWPGSGYGWAVVYAGGTSDEAVKCASVSTADNIYRLWFGIDRAVYYIPLNVNLLNPLELSTYTYGASCIHQYPWFDANNTVVDKTAHKVTVYVSGASATEYVKIFYGSNYDDDTWTLLTNSTYSDGQIDANGETEFTFASQAGLNFKSIRFKAELYRGGTTTKTPDPQWLRLNYVKRPDDQYVYEAAIDCSRDYRFQRSSTLLDNLKTAKETKTFLAFEYRTHQGTTETHYVQVQDYQGYVEAGRTKEGVYAVRLVAL